MLYYMYGDHTWSEDYVWDNIATSVNSESQYRTNSKTTMPIIFSANNSFRAVVDYESYKFYKYSCKILRYYILEGMGAGRGGA